MFRPNGLALDSDNKKLYWCDAKLDRVEMASIDGSDRKVVADKNLPHPFGFSLLGENLYWTDWQDRNIKRADKQDGGNRLVMVSHLDDLVSDHYDVKTTLCSHFSLFLDGSEGSVHLTREASDRVRGGHGELLPPVPQHPAGPHLRLSHGARAGP